MSEVQRAAHHPAGGRLKFWRMNFSVPARPVRALVILGRVSNLPTVWSNCLAGWVLGGGGFTGDEPGRVLLLGAGATLLYLGGMFLNDAWDAPFDRQHRPERPIPSGAIRERRADASRP